MNQNKTDKDIERYKDLTKEEASNLCGHDGLRNFGFNMVGGDFYVMESGKWKFIKRFPYGK